MRFCVKCGEPLVPGEGNCRNCGAKVEIRSSVYNSDALELDEEFVAETVKKKTIKAKIAFAAGIIFFVAFIMAGLRITWEPAKADRLREMTAYAFNIWWAIAIVSCIVASNCSASALSKVHWKQLLSGKTLGLAKASKIMSIISAGLCILWILFVCYIGLGWFVEEARYAVS